MSPEKRLRLAWLAIAAVLPTAIVFYASAITILNHFHLGPFLHDSGWYSAIVYRQGFFPETPEVAHPLRDYYGIHVSLLVSIASVLSYAFPGDRVDWYALFQGVVYAPLGLATAMIVPRATGTPGAVLRDALVVGAASLAFALNGQVLACFGYPHYEIAAAVGLCFLLAGLATGRTKLAWAGLAIAAATREDGGFHAALFVAAVLASDFFGVPFPTARRTLVRMLVVAVGASLLAFAVQKVFFVSANLFRHEYLGEPAFAHLSGAGLVRRLGIFWDKARFVAFPLLGTAAIAIATRDARYMLGWVAELPWLLVNLLAAQELKADIRLYTGFPFVASIFWVAAYTMVRRRATRPRGAALSFVAAVSILATLGFRSSYPDPFRHTVHWAVFRASIDRASLMTAIAPLRRDPNAYGRVYVDEAVASWTLEAMPSSARLPEAGDVPYAERDGFAFFRSTLYSDRAYDALSRSPYSRCGRAEGTPFFLCVREGHALPGSLITASPLLASVYPVEGIAERRGEDVVVRAATEPSVATHGPFLRFSPGRYVARWSYRMIDCPETSGAEFRVDVCRPFADLAIGAASAVEGEARLLFEIADDPPKIELRSWTGPCAYEIVDLDLRVAPD